MKYYKLDQTYYKQDGQRIERVSAYRHHFGIIQSHTSQFETDAMEEITEEQYMRARKLIKAKID